MHETQTGFREIGGQKIYYRVAGSFNRVMGAFLQQHVSSASQ